MSKDRQTFLDSVLELLKSEGFSQITETQFKHSSETSGPCRKVIINGRLHEEKSTTKIDVVVNLIGEGYCQTDITTDFFEQISVQIYANGSIVSEEEVCIFYDWLYDFEQLINRIKNVNFI